MTPHTGMTQETIVNIDPNDTMIPTDTINAINETVPDRRINSTDTNHEALADSETTHAIVTIFHAHQVVFALKTDAHNGTMNIHGLTHPYAICHVSDVAVHNTHLQTENVLHHLNKSRPT